MTKIQLRRGTAAQWTSANPTLDVGEPGYETDSRKQKIGDGVTPWTELSYSGGGGVAGGLVQVFTMAGSLIQTSDDPPRFYPRSIGRVSEVWASLSVYGSTTTSIRIYWGSYDTDWYSVDIDLASGEQEMLSVVPQSETGFLDSEWIEVWVTEVGTGAKNLSVQVYYELG
jgi:hypothetical protein